MNEKKLITLLKELEKRIEALERKVFGKDTVSSSQNPDQQEDDRPEPPGNG